MNYKIVDEPPPNESSHRWGELRKLLEKLPAGKWVEASPAEGENLYRFQSSLVTSLRRFFKLQTRRANGKMYISRLDTHIPITHIPERKR